MSDNQTPDPTPALLSAARLAEIRARESRATAGPWRVSTQAHDDRPRTLEVCDLVNDTWVVTDHHLSNYRDDAAFIAHARQDIPALLAHLDALTPRAVDGEALGRAAWVARADAPKWGIPEERVAEHMRASFDNQPDDERARYTRIGTRLHAIGYAAGAVAMTGEGDDPAVEGAVYILMERHDRELREAHAAGRSEGEAAESETTRHLIDARNLAQRTAEDAHREIARLTAELAEARAAVESFQRGSGCIDGYTIGEALAKIGASLDRTPTEGIPDAIARLKRAAETARREGAREEREAIETFLRVEMHNSERAGQAEEERALYDALDWVRARDAAPVEGEDGAT